MRYFKRASSATTEFKVIKLAGIVKAIFTEPARNCVRTTNSRLDYSRSRLILRFTKQRISSCNWSARFTYSQETPKRSRRTSYSVQCFRVPFVKYFLRIQIMHDSLFGMLNRTFSLISLLLRSDHLHFMELKQTDKTQQEITLLSRNKCQAKLCKPWY